MGATLERIWRKVLTRRLKGRLGGRLSVAITDNTHTMVSFKRRRGEFRVRLHHMFLAAPDEVVGSLAEYLQTHDPTASQRLDRFIAQNKVFIRRVTPSELRARVPIEPKGAAHQLQEIFDDLNRRFFKGQVKATITYARVPRAKKVRKSIKLGSYSSESRVIRIHPALDQAWVPDYFIQWIVFHEMLHHLVPVVTRNAKRCVHTPEFTAREKRFPFYDKARRWEERNLEYLLRYRVSR